MLGLVDSNTGLERDSSSLIKPADWNPLLLIVESLSSIGAASSLMSPSLAIKRGLSLTSEVDTIDKDWLRWSLGVNAAIFKAFITAALFFDLLFKLDSNANESVLGVCFIIGEEIDEVSTLEPILSILGLWIS